MRARKGYEAPWGQRTRQEPQLGHGLCGTMSSALESTQRRPCDTELSKSPISGTVPNPGHKNQYQIPAQRSSTTIQESDVRVDLDQQQQEDGQKRSRSSQASGARSQDPETLARSQGSRQPETSAPGAPSHSSSPTGAGQATVAPTAGSHSLPC